MTFRLPQIIHTLFKVGGVARGPESWTDRRSPVLVSPLAPPGRLGSSQPGLLDPPPNRLPSMAYKQQPSRSQAGAPGAAARSDTKGVELAHRGDCPASRRPCRLGHGRHTAERQTSMPAEQKQKSREGAVTSCVGICPPSSHPLARFTSARVPALSQCATCTRDTRLFAAATRQCSRRGTGPYTAGCGRCRRRQGPPCTRHTRAPRPLP